GGLLGGAALGVDGGGRSRERQPGAEPGGAPDVERLLAPLADAAGDNLADGRRVDARAGDELGEGGGEQVRRMHARQPAVAAADRGADGFDDHDLGHGSPATGGGGGVS